MKVIRSIIAAYLHVSKKMLIRWKSRSTETLESIGDAIKYVIYGVKPIIEENFPFTRMAVLEARAAKRMTKPTLFFLPIMIFGFAFGLGRLL